MKRNTNKNRQDKKLTHSHLMVLIFWASRSSSSHPDSIKPPARRRFAIYHISSPKTHPEPLSVPVGSNCFPGKEAFVQPFHY
ncbi:hypothetical protein CDAR_413071 [Caerostris darwini]|uniref:Ycf15 n=1 Tax=Caerostris darwini TaxID=1538125 RepID=A0AAV4RBL7_9ARAC|nr:hypothetical protein CDAR_413071 [Caerostris darwini]